MKLDDILESFKPHTMIQKAMTKKRKEELEKRQGRPYGSKPKDKTPKEM